MTVPPRFRLRALPRDLAVCVAAGCAIAESGRAFAQEAAPPKQLDPGVVIATRTAERAFDLRGFARLNNFANVNYVGSVSVGDTNGRYFEPAPTRNFLVGVSVSASF